MKKKLHIAIAGTRGIPNNYGGFEQCAQYLSEGLANAGHSVTVYCSSQHPDRQHDYKGVQLVYCNDPENKWGTAGQFMYDLNCIKDAARRKFDAIIFMGYTSSSVWWRRFPATTAIFTNMDGLEWRRSKYNRLVQLFLKYAERMAVKHSHYLVADSAAVKEYIEKKYTKRATYISYGAEILNTENLQHLEKYNLQPDIYYMLMCRMEPENNIEMILEGYNLSRSEKKILLIGNTEKGYGRKLEQRYKSASVIFAGPVFNKEELHSLKVYCSIYFHGHSVGGTNPSLLEAMASRALIAAHNNVFNKAVLGDHALYFSSAEEVCQIITSSPIYAPEMKKKNLEKINSEHNWSFITEQYEKLFLEGVTNYADIK